MQSINNKVPVIGLRVYLVIPVEIAKDNLAFVKWVWGMHSSLQAITIEKDDCINERGLK